MCPHVLYSGYHRFFSKMKQIQAIFPYLVKSCAWFRGGTYLCLPESGQWPTYLPTHLVCRVFKHVWGPLKSQQGSTQAGYIGPKPTANSKKKGLAWVYAPWPKSDPFLLQNLDKNRPKSSQNFTPILWLVQITTHYKEQLLQNQGEFMVKRGPLESKEDLEGHNRASLTVYSAYLSAYL